MEEEIFDVVNAKDEVVGQASRTEVHAKRLPHRAVHIFVFNSQKELLLQKRADTKDEFPSCYTSSASGHVHSGESYEKAAQRELKEELGLSLPLKMIGKFPANREMAMEHTVLFLAVTDQPVQANPEEIARVAFYPLAQIADWLRQNPDHFTSPFRVLFDWYMTHQRFPGV